MWLRPHQERVLAYNSTICPLCSRFIAKKRSWIVRLPEPLVPRGDSRHSADDGHAYYYDARPISMHPRKWCHAACRPRYDQPPRYRELRNNSNAVTYTWPEGWNGLGKYSRGAA